MGMRDFELQELTIEPKRGKALIIFFAVVFLLLVVKLWSLQIIQGEQLSEVALNQRTRVVPLLAPRGIIYDRNGIPLVSNRLAFTVSILPDVAAQVRKSPEEVKLLSELLEISEEKILAALSPSRKDRLGYEPFRILEDAGADKALRIYEQGWRLPGVIVEKVPVRHYVYDNFASHMLGHVGMISIDELRNWSELGYGANHKVGKYGLERYYEFELKGQDGAFEIEIDAKQMPVKELSRKNPTRGNDLILTMDYSLQSIVENKLRKKDLQIQKETGERLAGASVVVLDPRNGQVLALANYPDFNPNTYNQDFLEIGKDKRSPLLNRAIRGTYPAGSAFKPLVMVGALNEGLVNEKTIFYDAPYPYGYGGWDPESKKRCVYGPHGYIDLLRGLQVSCNIPFYVMGRELGIDRLSEYARLFGFGEKTGIDLYPEEASGLIPDRDWKRDSFKKGEDKIWYPVETLDVAIGQGAMKVTPLQMAVFFSILANEGDVYQPYLVKEIRDSSGEVVCQFEPQIKRTIKLSPKTISILKEALEKVTIPGGTAARAFADFPLKVAGKTGSAEVPGKESHAWFVGYLPADKPELVIAVLVEHGGAGGAVSAPLAREILEEYLFPSEEIELKNE